MQKKGDLQNVLVVVIVAIVVLLIFVTIYGQKMLNPLREQEYDEFACRQMLEQLEQYRITKDIGYGAATIRVMDYNPLEISEAEKKCGLVLGEMIEDNRGNITEIIAELSNEVCIYGEEHDFPKVTKVRSMTVNVTDGNIGFADLKPHLDPECHLIWRIYHSEIENKDIQEEARGKTLEEVEAQYNAGEILQNEAVTIQIRYFKVPIKKLTGKISYLGFTPIGASENKGMIEVQADPD